MTIIAPLIIAAFLAFMPSEKNVASTSSTIKTDSYQVEMSSQTIADLEMEAAAKQAIIEYLSGTDLPQEIVPSTNIVTGTIEVKRGESKQ